MTRTHRAVAISTMILLLAGCSLLQRVGAGDLNGEWTLNAGSNAGKPIPIVPAARITLRIDGGQVGGTAACNQYGGKLQLGGSTFTITDLFQTEMACLDDAVMASEAAYMGALAKVTSAARNGNALVLSGPQIELRFALVPPVPDAALVGPTWVLDSLISGEAVSSTVGPPATLQLNADGTFAASTGCRTVNGTYSISGSEVKVTLNPYDLIGCPDPVGAQDQHVLAVIGDGFTVAVTGQSLTLTAGNKGLGYGVQVPAASPA